MKKTPILGSLVLLLISCTTAGEILKPTEENLKKEGINPLSQAELETLFEGGLTISFKGARASGTVIHHTDGKLEIRWGPEPNQNDTGIYSLRDGKFCAKYTTIRDGKESCIKFYKVGDNKYMSFKQDGTLNSEFSIIQ